MNGIGSIKKLSNGDTTLTIGQHIYLIKNDDLITPLGEGEFAKVFKATRDDITFAIKKIPIIVVDAQRISQKIEFMKKLGGSKHITKFIESANTKDGEHSYMYIVMEYDEATLTRIIVDISEEQEIIECLGKYAMVSM